MHVNVQVVYLTMLQVFRSLDTFPHQDISLHSKWHGFQLYFKQPYFKTIEGGWRMTTLQILSWPNTPYKWRCKCLVELAFKSTIWFICITMCQCLIMARIFEGLSWRTLCSRYKAVTTFIICFYTRGIKFHHTSVSVRVWIWLSEYIIRNVKHLS